MDLFSSYEGLPPNFSLLQNMAAGAFAGIAVSSSDKRNMLDKAPETNIPIGAYCGLSD